MDTISYEQFQQLDLRIALVEAAEPHPNADRLVVLKIRIGEERRQIVAGIRLQYPPESLVGRRIVVVTNLAPAVLRGVESQGMLLAASAGNSLKVVTVDGDIPSGAKVK